MAHFADRLLGERTPHEDLQIEGLLSAIAARGFLNPEAILTATGGNRTILDAAFHISGKRKEVPSLELLLTLAWCERQNCLEEAVLLIDKKGVPLGQIRDVLFYSRTIRSDPEHRRAFHSFLDTLQRYIAGNRREHWRKVYDRVWEMVVTARTYTELTFRDAGEILNGLNEAGVGKDHWPLVIWHIYRHHMWAVSAAKCESRPLPKPDLSPAREAVGIQMKIRAPFATIFRRLSLTKAYGEEVAAAVMSLNQPGHQDWNLGFYVAKQGVDAVRAQLKSKEEGRSGREGSFLICPGTRVAVEIFGTNGGLPIAELATGRRDFLDSEVVRVEVVPSGGTLLIHEIQSSDNVVPAWQEMALHQVEEWARGKGFSRMLLSTAYDVLGRVLPTASVKNLDRIYRQVPQEEGWNLVAGDRFEIEAPRTDFCKGKYYWMRNLES